MHRLVVSVSIASAVVLKRTMFLVGRFLVVSLPIFVELIDTLSAVLSVLALREGFLALLLAVTSLEFVRAASDGYCELNCEVFILVVLFLLFVQIH